MVSAILLAWWLSNRFWWNKMKALLWWVPIFLHSLIKFYKNPLITEIVIVAKEEEIEDYKLLQKQFPKIKHIVAWGEERQDSVSKWIEFVSNEVTLIHNWANPLVTDNEINDIINATKEYWASAPWLKSKNTLKTVDEHWFVIKTIDRNYVWEMQTPQWINTDKFRKLLENQEWNTVFTDDVSFFEYAWLPVKITQASEQNFKITTQEDLIKAQSFIKQDLRIGIGHDSHRFYEQGKRREETKQNSIILWWVQILSDKTIDANSDWDVLIHTICNAIWTAIWEWSLSLYSEEMCKNWITDSSEYLKHIVKSMKSKWYVIWNVSASIEAREPKLEKYIPIMKEKLSELIECSTFQIWIACTSWENLTDFGRGLWIQCFVNVILKKIIGTNNI